MYFHSLKRFAISTIVYLYNKNDLLTQKAFTRIQQSSKLPHKNQDSWVTILI